MSLKVWIDDERPTPYGWVSAKTSLQAIELLEGLRLDNVQPAVVSFDHDLGGDDTSRRVVLWMCENDFWPLEARVHSANPVGVEWLEGMITRYGPGVTR